MVNKLRKLMIVSAASGAILCGGSAAYAQSHGGGHGGGGFHGGGYHGGGFHGGYHGGGFHGGGFHGGGFHGGGFHRGFGFGFGGVYIGPGYSPFWSGYGYDPGYYGQSYYLDGDGADAVPYGYDPYTGYPAAGGGYVPPPPMPQATVAPPPADLPPDDGSTIDETHCRNFQSSAVVDGQSQRLSGVACLQPDGSWRIVR